MVRGPMMAEVIPGWLRTKAMAIWMRLMPVSSASWARASTASSLRLLAAVLAPAARQPTAGQRAVGHHAHAMALAGGQDVVFDPAHEHRVSRLLGDEALEAAVAGHPLGFDDLAGGEGGGTEVADLALADE